MGAKLPPPRRLLNLRNPLTRLVAVTLTVFGFFFLTFRSDYFDVQTAVADQSSRAGTGALSQDQRPLTGSGENALSTPAAPGGRVQETHTSSHNLSSQSADCGYDMTRLRVLQERYGLQEKFEYLKRHVKISRTATTRKSLTTLQQSLLPAESFKQISVNKNYGGEACPAPLVVPVTKSPYPATAKASDFIFGVSTTYKRFTDPKTSPVNEWSYWLTDSKGNSNGGKLILLLLDATESELLDAHNTLAGLGIDANVLHSDGDRIMAVRYLSLVPGLYDHPARLGRKWLVTCDDDTFFPSFNGLAARLAEYDHTKPMYIGTFSEDVNNVNRHGAQAFGGAGVFLSMPTAELVTRRFDSCVTEQKLKEADSGWGPQGDILLRKCIYDNSETKVTILNDLWQLDMYGDASGFYESGLKPLSLHHYSGGSWHVAYPWHYTKVAHLCGEDCTLQRFRTADDFVISNGFSVAHYPKGVDFDLAQVERTFWPGPPDNGWNYDYTFGPQRPALLKTGRKMSWDLREATVNADGSVSQVYIRKADDYRWKDTEDKPMSSVDGLIELVWAD